jgi:hypothetical protein
MWCAYIKRDRITSNNTRHFMQSRGRKVTRLYCFDGLAAGSDVSCGFLTERHGDHIQEPPLVVAMIDLEREERSRYGSKPLRGLPFCRRMEGRP